MWTYLKCIIGMHLSELLNVYCDAFQIANIIIFIVMSFIYLVEVPL